MATSSINLRALQNPFFAQATPAQAFFNAAYPNPAGDPTAAPASPDSAAPANTQPGAATAQPASVATPAPANPEGVAPVTPVTPIAPAGPLSRDAFFQQNPDATKAFVPPRPAGELDNVHGFRKGLALAFGGLADMGAGLLHREDPTLGRWTGQELAERQYDANLPHLQAEAGNQAYQRYLGEQQQLGEQAHSAAETQNLQQMSPAIQRKAQFLAQLQGEAESGRYDPAALKARALRMARAGNVVVDPTEIDDVIQNTKALGAKYQIQQDKNDRPEFLTDRQGRRIFPDANGKFSDPEAQAQWDATTTAHNQSIQEETNKQERVAGFAASRQAAGFENAARMQLQQHNFEQDQKRKADLLTQDQALNDTNARVEGIQNMAQMAKNGNSAAASAAFMESVGLPLSVIGTKRLNGTELETFANQGSLQRRIANKIANAENGSRFDDETWNDISKWADQELQGAQHKHDNNVQVINTRYGYQAPAAKSAGGAQKAAPEPAASSQAAPEGTVVQVNGKNMVKRNGQWLPQ